MTEVVTNAILAPLAGVDAVAVERAARCVWRCNGYILSPEVIEILEVLELAT